MLFWGYNFISLKVLYEVMPPGAVLLCRFIVMWIVLAGICLAMGESIIPPKEHRWRILFTGFNSMGVYMILFMEGVKLSTAAESAIILVSVPIMVLLGAMVSKMEAFSWSKVAGSLIAVLGVALVVFGRPVGKGASNRFLGDGLLFLSAIAWAWSVLLAKPLAQKIKPLPLFTMSMLGGIPLAFGYGLMPSLSVKWSSFEVVHWLNFAQISFGSGVIAMAFYYKGIQQLPASAVTLHQFLVPILATGFGAIFLSERLVLQQGIGLVILMFGVLVAVGVLRGNQKVKSYEQ
jgi:drug/metabolite transporter (DMT)-like permease